MRRTASAFALLGALLAGCSAGGGADVPTYVAGRGTLRPVIAGRGAMAPTHATAVVAPRSVSAKPFVIAWIVPDGTRVRRGDPIARFALETLEQELAQRTVEATEARFAADAKQREMQRKETALRDSVAVNEMKLQLSDRFRSGGELASTRLEIADAVDEFEFLSGKQRALGDAVDRLREQLGAEVGVLTQRLEAAETQRARAAADIRRAEIRAPHEGIVTLESTWTGEPLRVGDAAFPGRKLATVSGVDRLKAVLHIAEVDAAGLRRGQPAQVSPTGHAGPLATGTVTGISEHASRLQANDPVRYFAVEVELDRQAAGLVPGRGIVGRIHPFPPRDVDVAVPAHAVQWNDNAAYVLRRDGAALREQPVRVGASDGALVEIESGLRAGDVVAIGGAP